MIFFAKDFDTRQELERKIASGIGLTAESKPKYSIEGTTMELKKLHLGDGSIFWGITVKVTDSAPAPIDKKKVERVNRGEIHKPKAESVDVGGSVEL